MEENPTKETIQFAIMELVCLLAELRKNEAFRSKYLFSILEKLKEDLLERFFFESLEEIETDVDASENSDLNKSFHNHNDSKTHNPKNKETK